MFDFLTGTNNDPGLLGVGNKQVQGLDIDKQDFQDPNAAENRRRVLATMQQGAPTANAAYSAPTARPQNAQAFVAGTATAGPTSIAHTDAPFRNAQSALTSDLLAQSRGEGPSLGTLALKMGTDRALSGQVAAAQASRGNPALAQRTAATQSAGINQDAAAQAAQIRMQEQQAARQQLGQVAESARGQDIGLNTSQAQLDAATREANAGRMQQTGMFNAGQNQDTSQFNANLGLSAAQMAQQNNQFNAGNQQQTNLANMQSQGQQNQLNQQYEQMLQGLDQQQIENLKDYWGLDVGQNNAINQINSNNYNASAANRGQIVSGIIGAGGAALAMSDRRVKKNIKPADTNIKSFLNKLQANK